MASKTRTITVTCNGEARTAPVAPRKLLCDFLREDVKLTGTNVGCEHGICGACTVLLNGEIVRSCLTLAVQADGQEVTTVEGLAQGGKLHAIQQAFYEKYGAQCGFCTPGQVMTAYALLRDHPDASEDEMREAMSGVLCRCTGYYHIMESVKEAQAKLRGGKAPAPAPAKPEAVAAGGGKSRKKGSK